MSNSDQSINQTGYQPLIEVQLLPPISYFSLIKTYQSVTLERYEHYIKQSYRNRCYIRGANGVEALIIPITTKHGKVIIKDIQIDHSQKWMSKFKRAIQSAYGKAPFFEFYVHDLWEILAKKHEFLYDLNRELLSLCLHWLHWNISIKETLIFEKEVKSPHIDYRDTINPKKGAEMNKFSLSKTYTQVFGNEFVRNLSVIDLIFCVGPEADSIILSPN